MRISTVTITGADSQVIPSMLHDLHQEYYWLEFGVLLSKKSLERANISRYPAPEWVDRLRNREIPLSGHVCGEWAKNIMEKSDMSVLDTKRGLFGRFQINYTFRPRAQFSFAPLVTWALENPKTSIILQYNLANAPFLNTWLAAKYLPGNIEILYDASGGNGIPLGDIEAMMPFHGHKTGYAGGINLDNVNSICESIIQVEHNDRVWIDMESGVRTDDKWDWAKVEKMCREVSNYVAT